MSLEARAIPFKSGWRQKGTEDKSQNRYKDLSEERGKHAGGPPVSEASMKQRGGKDGDLGLFLSQRVKWGDKSYVPDAYLSLGLNAGREDPSSGIVPGRQVPKP